MKQRENSPRLRFGGFNKPWEKTNLKEVFLCLESGVSVNALDEPVTANFQRGILKTSSVQSGIFQPNENKVIIKEELKRAKLNPKKDSILISRMNTLQLVGESALITKDYPYLFIPDRLWMGTVNNQKFHPKFIAQYLLSEKARNKVSNIATGTSGSMKNISQGSFLNLELVSPSLPEQTQIADFLTSIDERLLALKQKKELLERYKKGTMQKFFSQQLRFKEVNGKDFPKWTVRSIADITEKRSSTISAKSLEKNHGPYKIYGASGLLKSIDFYQEDSEYIGIVKDGAGVGRLFICAPQSSVLGTLDIIKNAESYNLHFIYYLLATIDFHQFVTGTTIPHIYFKDYSKTKVAIPCLKEQIKIANFLSAIDQKIEVCSLQIAKTEQYKKGLLQQMFV